MNQTLMAYFEQRPWPLLLGLSALLFVFMIGGHTFWDIDEPINAQCAKEMLLANNWLVPMFNEEIRSGKPILTYWLMLTSYSIFGINEFSARLPSALSITALGLILTYFGRRMLGNRAGLMAGLLFISSLHIIVISRAATPDAVFMLTLCTGLLAALCYLAEGLQNRPLLWTAYIALGLAVLAKGPVAIGIPGLIFIAYLVVTGNYRQWGAFCPWRGLAIILAISLPWYIAVTIATEGLWLQEFIFTHNLHRFSEPMEGHKGFPGFYLLTTSLGVFPWTGIFIGMLIAGPWRPRLLREDPVRAFLMVWFVVFIIFFSIARTQLPNYVLPSFPAIALLMAMWIRDNSREKVFKYLLYGAAPISLLLLFGAAAALQWQWSGEWVYALIFLPLTVAAATAWFFRQYASSLLVAGMISMTMLLAGWVLPGFENHKVTRPFAEAAMKAGFGCDELAGYKYFQPSLRFYFCGHIDMLPGVPAVVSWLGEGKAVVMPATSIAELPQRLQSNLIIHDRGVGLYARRELVLISSEVR